MTSRGTNAWRRGLLPLLALFLLDCNTGSFGEVERHCERAPSCDKECKDTDEAVVCTVGEPRMDGCESSYANCVKISGPVFCCPME